MYKVEGGMSSWDAPRRDGRGEVPVRLGFGSSGKLERTGRTSSYPKSKLGAATIGPRGARMLRKERPYARTFWCPVALSESR